MMTRVDYLLAELRCASLRAQLWAAEIDAVGVALESGLIDPERALELLRDRGALQPAGGGDDSAASDLLERAGERGEAS
jgi:hypothetical protein